MEKSLFGNVRQRVKIFFQEGLSHFNKNDLPNKDSIIKISATFLGIAVLSFLFYFLANSLAPRPNLRAYLLNACEEGVSVYFWNILAAFGLFLFGIMVLFPYKHLATSISAVLSSVNSISVVMFGLLAAQMTYGIAVSSAALWIKILGFGLGGTVCLLVLLCLIAIIWLASYLSGQENFLNKIRQTRLAIRIPAASILLFMLLIWGYLQG